MMMRIEPLGTVKLRSRSTTWSSKARETRSNSTAEDMTPLSCEIRGRPSAQRENPFDHLADDAVGRGRAGRHADRDRTRGQPALAARRRRRADRTMTDGAGVQARRTVDVKGTDARVDHARE